jgi:hypothetical protein
VNPYCSELARQQRAPLAGTASRATAWILLEHPGPWGRLALTESALEPAVGEWLDRQLGALEGARALLVRQERGGHPVGRSLFVAFTSERDQRLYRFHFATVEELVDLELPALALRERKEGSTEGRGLLLTCANGRRDRCCGRRGMPTYRALRELIAEAAWQSSHLGGHRYAATGLALPEGVAYGFLGPEDAGALCRARAHGEIHLPRYRGRCFHPAPAQAADAWLRSRHDLRGLSDVRLEGIEAPTDGTWEVRLATRGGGRHRLLVREGLEEAALVSCTPAKRRDVAAFEVVPEP